MWRDPSLGRTTFAEWARECMTANPAKRATTAARDKVVLETHFIPTLGDRSLTRITPAHIKGCVDAMVARLAPATVRANVGVLKAVFNAAVDAELIAPLPTRAIKVTGGMTPERPTLRLDQLDRLADAVSGNYRVLILVAGVLGLRWSECVGLQIDDVNFLRRTLTVRRTIAEVEGRFHAADTKTRASGRTLTVPSFLIDELARHIAAHRPHAGKEDLLFTSPQCGPLRRYFEERIFRPAVAKTGVAESLTFHGLRHIAASLMVEQGEHPQVIQARLGHPTARLSMELYAHVPEATDRDVP
jgi:integrase